MLREWAGPLQVVAGSTAFSLTASPAVAANVRDCYRADALPGQSTESFGLPLLATVAQQEWQDTLSPTAPQLLPADRS
jgi:hypothetical protein